MLLKLSHLKNEGTLNVSKWIKHQVLLGANEMQKLFAHLPPFSFYNVSEVVTSEEMVLTQERFLHLYEEYIETLESGALADEKKLRRYFSSIASVTPDILYAMKVKEKSYLVKPIRPVVQLQLHHFLPSESDGKYYPMVLGKESVTWGLQFSYPQIFQHPQTQAFSKVTDGIEFPNTPLFTAMVKWFRNYTMPTTFIWKEKKSTTPMRIGKEALSWIHSHPQLRSKGIRIRVSGIDFSH